MAKKYIERDAVMEAVLRVANAPTTTRKESAILRGFGLILNGLPAVEAEPVRRGKWIPHVTEDGVLSGYDCSVCGQWFFMGPNNHNYCCDCGAKMEESSDEAD